MADQDLDDLDAAGLSAELTRTLAEAETVLAGARELLQAERAQRQALASHQQYLVRVLAAQNRMILEQNRVIALLGGQIVRHQDVAETYRAELQLSLQVNHDLMGQLEDAHLRISDAQRQTQI